MKRIKCMRNGIVGLLCLAATPVLAEGNTLAEVMRQLGVEASRLTAALVAEDWEGAAAAARAIAHHPPLAQAERQRVMATLGDEMARFRSHDQAVHGAAEGLVAAAAQRDAGEALRWHGRMLEGCVACHSDFRARLQAPERRP